MTDYTDQQKEAIERISGAIPFRLARLNVVLNAQAQATLSQASELSLSQWRIFFLVHHLQPVTSKIINNLTLIDPAVISRSAKSLHDAGLIALQRNSQDQRERVMGLTPQGRTLMERLGPMMADRRLQLDNALTEEEHRMLDSIIGKLEHQAAVSDDV